MNKEKIDVNRCMASLLELIANIWVNFDKLSGWLYMRLLTLYKQDHIDYIHYIDSTKEILASKSVVSESIFSDFIGILESQNMMTEIEAS